MCSVIAAGQRESARRGSRIELDSANHGPQSDLACRCSRPRRLGVRCDRRRPGDRAGGHPDRAGRPGSRFAEDGATMGASNRLAGRQVYRREGPRGVLDHPDPRQCRRDHRHPGAYDPVRSRADPYERHGAGRCRCDHFLARHQRAARRARGRQLRGRDQLGGRRPRCAR
jgi:hypothetical protein